MTKYRISGVVDLEPVDETEPPVDPPVEPPIEPPIEPPPVEAGVMVAPGYTFVTRVDASTNFDNAFRRHMEGLPNYTVLTVAAHWDKAEGPAEGNYANLHTMIDKALPIVEDLGIYLGFEMDGQRFGGGLGHRAYMPQYMHQNQSRFPRDSRGAPYDKQPGMYYPSSDPNTGGWLERLWGEEMNEYIERKVALHVEVLKYLNKKGKGHLLSHVNMTSESSKKNSPVQPAYSDTKYVAGLQRMARRTREELDANGGEHVAVFFGMNNWTSGWANGRLGERVLEPIASQGYRIGFSVQDYQVTHGSLNCKPYDIEKHLKGECYQACLDFNGTVPFMIRADWQFYVTCDTYTGKNQTVADATRATNGWLIHDKPGYDKEVGFWPKLSKGRQGIFPHLFQLMWRGEYADVINDGVRDVKLMQQIEQKQYP